MKKKQPCVHCGGTGYENDHAEIGMTLKLARIRRGVPAKEIAQKMGISAQMLSDMEHGHRRWTKERIAQYKKAIGE